MGWEGILGGGMVFGELSGMAGTGDPKFPSFPWDVPGGKKGIFTEIPPLELERSP